MSTHLAVKNLGFYALHIGTRFLTPVLVAPFLAKVFGPEEFAEYVIWNACVWSAMLIMEFGFHLYAVTATARAQTQAELAAVISSIVTAKILLAPLALAGFLSAAYVLGLFEREPIAVCAGVVALLCYGLTFAWYFQGLQRGATAVLVDAIPQASQLLLVLMLVSEQGQFWRVAVLQALAPMTTLLMSIYLVRRRNLVIVPAFADAVKAIRAAFPYFIERASFTLYSTATPIIVATISTQEQAAFYGLAEKVHILLTALTFATIQAFAPIAAVRAAQRPPDWSLIVKIIFGLALVTLLGALVTTLAIGPFVTHVLGDQYAGMVEVAQMFCVVSVIFAVQMSISTLIVLPSGRTKVLLVTSTIALFITLTMQVVLVPQYGALGSVIARACAELVLAVIMVTVAFRLIKRR